MRLHNHILPVALILIGSLVYYNGNTGLKNYPRPTLDESLRVVMPAYVQTILAWGDRYLAADLGLFRAVTLSAYVRDRTSLQVQAKIQQQASILNPRHEDNGYLSAAMLPWEGEVEIAQWILDRATRYRDWDPEPPFYQGFNEYYFNKNNELAGKLATIASDRSEGKNKRYFRVVASRWYAKTADTRLAINLLKALRESTTDKDIKRNLEARIMQVEGLQTIQTAIDLYRFIKGEDPGDISVLLNENILIAIPNDPFNFGYGLDEEGNAVVLTPGQGQS